jgi:putative Mg2+ transporter-C (MgtC) family protein
VQGIGFLGAGLILHTKSKVLGLTSAATVFVVAAIGMTCGAGLYLEALIATLLVLVALQIVGTFEKRLGWKHYAMVYEVRADLGTDEPATALNRMQKAILAALDRAGLRLAVLERDNVAGLERVSFTVLATRKVHERMLKELRASDATDQVEVFKDMDDE